MRGWIFEDEHKSRPLATSCWGAKREDGEQREGAGNSVRIVYCLLGSHANKGLWEKSYEGWLVLVVWYREKSAAQSNPRGIPYAPFVDKVEDYVATRDDVEPTLRSFQEMIAWVCCGSVGGGWELGADEGLGWQEISVYGAELATARGWVEGQVAGYPEDVGYREVLGSEKGWLRSRQGRGAFANMGQDETEPIETTFELNETLHARAEIPPTDEVYLWLGVRYIFLLGGAC
jgi:hypothetical protein